jgi:hypothetical protein
MSSNNINEKSFWDELKEENRPIVNHSLCVFVNILSLVFLAVVLMGLEIIFPDKKDFISKVKIVDLWLVFGLLCLLGIKTLIIIAIKSWKHIQYEWNKSE